MTVSVATIGNVQEVTVSRTFKFNLGNYESLDTFAAVKRTIPLDADLSAYAVEMGDALNTLQLEDILRAAKFTKEPKSVSRTIE